MRLRNRVEKLEARLPDGMKRCHSIPSTTIRRKTKRLLPMKPRTGRPVPTMERYCVSSPANLSRRLRQLEAMQPDTETLRPFLWSYGQPLAEALEGAGLSLDDKSLFAIRLIPAAPGGGHLGPDPVYERDRHLLD